MFKDTANSTSVLSLTFSTSAVDDFVRHSTERRLDVLHARAADLVECALAVARLTGTACLLVSSDEDARAAMYLLKDAARATALPVGGVRAVVWPSEGTPANFDGAVGVAIAALSLQARRDDIAAWLRATQPDCKMIALCRRRVALVVQ